MLMLPLPFVRHYKKTWIWSFSLLKTWHI